MLQKNSVSTRRGSGSAPHFGFDLIERATDEYYQKKDGTTNTNIITLQRHPKNQNFSFSFF